MTALAGPSVLALVGDRTGPSLWRVFQPFKALQERGYPADWDYTSAAGISRWVNERELILLPRMSWHVPWKGIARAMFEDFKRAGRPIVYDTDDDLFTEAAVGHLQATGLTEGKSAEALEAERRQRIWTLQQCDGVTVSVPHLAELARTFTDAPVIVVRNAIDVPWFRTAVRARKRQNSAVTIGWVGGQRPDRDVAVMAAAWAVLAARHPLVRFRVGGYAPPVIRAAIPPSRLEVVPWLPLERYPEAFGGLDVACCAVADDPFNRCKSPIKAYESAVAGAAVIGTPTVYGEVIRHGENGYLAESFDDWAWALEMLVTRPSHRAILARRLLRDVERHHALAANLWRWPDAWQQIADHVRARRGALKLARSAALPRGPGDAFPVA